MLAASTRSIHSPLMGPQEGSDHLFLLPGCVLDMDKSQLRRDLAGLDFNVSLLQDAPRGKVWLSGAAPSGNDVHHRPSRPSSANRDHRLSKYDHNSTSAAAGDDEARDSQGSRDREERLRSVRDRQTEERARRLEELKAHALAAQRFREQKEEERRKRIEELRVRDTDRRSQVEERKKAIWEAERDRRESILRRNQERDARLDSKRRNDRSSAVFAFGSSTPRMLEPADTGGSFWGHRRATSTTNVTFSATPLTRRSSERELDGTGKKRATSAGGLDRQNTEEEAQDPTSAAYRHTVARRRTDLIPTIPSPREGVAPTASTSGSRASLHGSSKNFTRAPGLRSGEVTPNVTSRPGSALSHQSTTSVVTRRPVTAPRRPRPISIAVTGVSVEQQQEALSRANNRHYSEDVKVKPSEKESSKPPIPRVHSATKKPPVKPEVPKRSHSEKVSKNSSLKSTPRVTPKATPLQSPGAENITSTIQQQIDDVSKSSEESVETATTTEITKQEISTERQIVETQRSESATVPIESAAVVKIDKDISQVAGIIESKPSDVQVELVTTPESSQNSQKVLVTNAEKVEVKVEDMLQPVLEVKIQVEEKKVVEGMVSGPPVTDKQVVDKPVTEKPFVGKPVTDKPVNDTMVVEKQVSDKSVVDTAVEQKNPEVKSVEQSLEVEAVDMTASMIAKIRITTEEEAKAALAERRRLAREEAERQAELERKRQIEAEEQEILRQQEEEERQRRLEEDTLRLVEEQRKAEEERLLQAIEETKKREEEDRKRREEEARQKVEKEELDKKAREEADKQREEMAKRLEQEEKEREARRKRVEAIMLRTRGKGTSNSTPTKADGEDRSPSEDKPLSDSSPPNESNIKISLQESYDQSVTEKENALINHCGYNPRIQHHDTNNIVTSEDKNGFDSVNQNTIQINGDESKKSFENGHRNGLTANTVTNTAELIVDNTIKQNHTNTLLDLSEFDSLANTTNTNIKNTSQNLINMAATVGSDSGLDQIIDLSTTLEDSVNRNNSPGITAPIIAFLENSDTNRDLSLL